LLIAGTGVAIGCGSEQEDAPISVLNRSAKAVSFEEYRDRAVRVIDGKRVYNVEWDLFFSTEDDLRAHLMSRIERETKKSTAIVDESTGNHVVFSKDKAMNIRYCISSDFGAQHSEVVADMASAAKAWQRVANVRFVYVPSQDDSCFSSASGQVDIAVISTPQNVSACGTPPSLPPDTNRAGAPGGRSGRWRSTTIQRHGPGLRSRPTRTSPRSEFFDTSSDTSWGYVTNTSAPVPDVKTR